MLVLPLITAGAPPPVKRAVAIAPEANEIGADLYFSTLRGIADVIQNPMVGESFVESARPRAAKAAKPRSAAQKKNAKMQSQAFKEANSKLRTKNGSLRKGKSQRDVALRAQKILKRMKNSPRSSRSTRKGQVRKTARRAYEPRRSGGGRK